MTDADGRFRIEGLVSDEPYQLQTFVEQEINIKQNGAEVSNRKSYSAATIAASLMLKPGEIRDLGEIRVVGQTIRSGLQPPRFELVD